MEYKKTLNLPKTDFPIKANPKIFESELLNFWEGQDIYGKMQTKNASCGKYILHDGPPYANGDIHLGHALNKVLKDIVVKYKSLCGFSSPFVPGWDCHGLPIETQLLKELGSDSRLDKIEFREKCRDYALKYVDVQRKEFKRLGVFADWEKPYLTLDPHYEEKIVEIFGILAERGYVYRGKKPIHWCPTCRTALAEAEIEYEDDRSPSIYVKFRLKRFTSKTPQLKMLDDLIQRGNVSVVIWTTTPWTLPSNVAIALHPAFEYVAMKVADDVYIIAEGLVDDFVHRLKIDGHKILTKFKGALLEGSIAAHPFIDREVLIVLDEMVTLEQGTGAVHIAPGHGEEDYKVSKKYDLPMIMPVDEKGYFTAEAGKYAGLKYDEANKIITEDMKADGSLLLLEFIKHSYPHCWRCKKPVIFRATEQWFISVDHDDLRGKALKAIADTKWYPLWGENRIRGMVQVRPDWCISRQRSWGVPIPVFYCKKCGKPHMTGIFNKAVREIFRKEGSSSWFSRTAEQILPSGTSCECGSKDFDKEEDILDVWFESGVSHFAVLCDERLKWPADLYLEGSDQHRGWFQSSLLTAVGAKGRAPYDAVLTHGFTVDEAGKKMSKSLGNVVDPQKVVEKYGADTLRLWVVSADFRDDMSASDSIFKNLSDAYGKIRNTCRFLISNLNDFDPSKDGVKYEKLMEIDKFALLKLSRLIERIRKAYDDFELHIVFHSIRDFCVSDLSALYLDIVKDRLYCAGKSSFERRSCQTVLFELLKNLTVLLAPIFSFTSEDIWKHVPGSSGSVFLSSMPVPEPKHLDKALEEKWDTILKVRGEVYRAMEGLRASKEICASLEAEALLFADKKTLEILRSAEDLASVFICSDVKLSDIDGAPSEAVDAAEVKDLRIVVRKAVSQKCERCWNLRETVGKISAHKTLCDRCAKVVDAIK